MQERLALSAALITLDAGKTLEACLASLAFVDDIVIVDAGSQDDTRSIATRFGARLIEQPWLGFGPQKRVAVEAARHDWVLCIDADEAVSAELARAIREALQSGRARAYEMARANYFLGRYLNHGEGFPDWSLRLFDRRAAQWSDAAVHERVVATVPVARLARRARLLHHSAETLGAYLEKQNRYTTLQAEHMAAGGARGSALRMVLSPLARFAKFYVLRGGFLDGTPGLVHSAIGAFASFMKHAKLREYSVHRP